MSLLSKMTKLMRNRAALPMLRRHVGVSTSIYAEDVLIERLLHPGRDGIYVDVGANHPIDGSNTYRLYLKGWRGLTLDPNPAFTQAFRTLRPRDTHLTVGVSQEPGILSYFEFESDNFNTLSRQRADDLVAEGNRIVRETQVRTERLRDIVERELRGAPIDLLNVDVEGFDLDVLRSLDLDVHRPSVMIVEDYARYISFMTGGRATPFEEFLRAKGYCPIAQSAWSCVLLAEDWQSLFRRSAAFAEERVQNSYMPGQFEKLPWAANA